MQVWNKRKSLEVSEMGWGREGVEEGDEDKSFSPHFMDLNRYFYRFSFLQMQTFLK